MKFCILLFTSWLSAFSSALTSATLLLYNYTFTACFFLLFAVASILIVYALRGICPCHYCSATRQVRHIQLCEACRAATTSSLPTPVT